MRGPSGGASYQTYEVYAINRDRLSIIVIAVPVARFAEFKSEMDEIAQGMTFGPAGALPAPVAASSVATNP